MKKHETRYTAPEKLHSLTLEQLISAWESTEYLHTPEVYTIRGWLMDEIESLAPHGFNAWLDQPSPKDKYLRRYVTANPMCLSCVCFCSDCNGTQEQSYTGCIYKKIVI